MTLAPTRVSLPVHPDGSTGAARKPVAPRPSGRPPRIHGLDALRAVAVLAVMTFHFFPTVLPGGFIGVDIFFVLSGFLITTLLVRERVRTTTVSLRAFWVRRARRLLPALVLVVVTCTALAGVLGGDVLVGIRSQVAGALTFSSNWVYVAQGATYSDDLSPQLFANFWSLAVEEQFYLLWPLALVAVYATRRSRAVGLAVTGLIGIGSAVLMAVTYQVGEDPSRVYYGTDTHLFGLMAGAFFALWFAPRTPEAPGRTSRWTPRPIASWGRWTTVLVGAASGTVLVALALALRTGSPLTYRGGLVLASLATVGVIAVLVRGQRVARVVEKGPLEWVGRRSYGLYLWHWPLVVLVAQVLDGAHPGRASQPLVAVTATVLTFAAAWISYRFVEKPVLDHGLRTVAADVARRVRDRVDAAWVERHGGWHTHGRRARLAASTLLVVLLVGAVGAAFVREPARSDLEAEILRGLEIADATTQQGADSPGATTSDDDAEVPGAPTPTPDPSPTAAAPGAGTPSPSPAPAVPAAPPVAVGPPPGDQVTVIGDSVTLISAEALHVALPGVYIDAAVSRQMKTTPEAVAALRAAGALRPYVVVSLATNSTVTDRVMDEALAAIGPGHHVVLVTGYGDRPWIGPTNDQIRAAAARYPDVVVADWQSALAAAPEGIGKDGVHPQGPGQDLYARTLVAGLTDAAGRAATG
ncbi:acyltransferase family protein [Sanguibacter sp. 25GB23B1]|uniref:acyltransferase family protein n=1 Tax=unclassified Sanguibacter TaxID=2645534 RepID=UPI0032AFF485